MEIENIAEETSANLNVVECTNDPQIQGMPWRISTFGLPFFFHKYPRGHVMCIRCEDLDDTIVAFLVAS
jgi:hypothetical protein